MRRWRAWWEVPSERREFGIVIHWVGADVIVGKRMLRISRWMQ